MLGQFIAGIFNVVTDTPIDGLLDAVSILPTNDAGGFGGGVMENLQENGM